MHCKDYVSNDMRVFTAPTYFNTTTRIFLDYENSQLRKAHIIKTLSKTHTIGHEFFEDFRCNGRRHF